ncbi:MAG: DUF1194 domain-containing protein [Yoonia sp.]|nr:DUF1194 domain-containing protein [Yoonia sp.]
MGQHGKHWQLVGLRALATAAAVCATPADACRLALVLAMDISSSVDATEDQLQRAGLAAALIDDDVQAAILASPSPVALSAFEWSGRFAQVGLLDWTLLRTPADIVAAADQIARSTRSRNDLPTSMGSALGHAAIQLTRAPDCLFKTIDLAGDGINNEGFGPPEAYHAFPFENVTVNGLVVLPPDLVEATEVLSFYRKTVARGPAAFIEVANGFNDYARAMRRKLLRELTTPMMGARDTPAAQAG